MPSSFIEFPYGVRHDHDGSRRIPVVIAEIPTGLGLYPARLLLDSGADVTMLPRYIADFAGLDFSRLPPLTVTGIAGRGLSCRKGVITLRIAKQTLPPIPCAYVDSNEAPLLLGRDGFFELFNITFDNRRKKVVLNPLF